MRDNRQNRVRFTTLAMLTAISCGLVFVNFPFPLFPAFKYELADVPILIATFSFGPVAGFLVILVAAFVQAFILGHDQLIGFTMHVLATGTFAMVAAVALLCGTLAMAVVMCFANYILDPIFYGMTKEAVAKLILPAILPFNLSKAGINAIVTFLIYKKISNMIHKNANKS